MSGRQESGGEMKGTDEAEGWKERKRDYDRGGRMDRKEVEEDRGIESERQMYARERKFRMKKKSDLDSEEKREVEKRGCSSGGKECKREKKER
jgi:hypothetical protein